MQKCERCGDSDIYTWWCNNPAAWGIHETSGRHLDHPKSEIEVMHRHCRACGYDWNESPPQPNSPLTPYGEALKRITELEAELLAARKLADDERANHNQNWENIRMAVGHKWGSPLGVVDMILELKRKAKASE